MEGKLHRRAFVRGAEHASSKLCFPAEENSYVADGDNMFKPEATAVSDRLPLQTIFFQFSYLERAAKRPIKLAANYPYERMKYGDTFTTKSLFGRL